MSARQPTRATAAPVSRADGVAQLDAQIAELEQQIAALRRERAAIERARADGRLLRAIARAVGARIFSASDLIEHAAVDPRLADVLGTPTPRQLGRRLARLGVRACGDYRLQFVERNNAGRVWEVNAVKHCGACDHDGAA